MDKANAVVEFCKANTAPIQELCPEINQYFKTSRGYEVWNNKTGLRYGINFDPTSWGGRDELPNLVPAREEYEAFYVRYISGLDAIEFARVFIMGGRGQNGITKEWSYESGTYFRYRPNRFFIFRNDANMYKPDGEVEEGKKFYCKEAISLMQDWYRRSVTNSEAVKNQIKMFGSEIKGIYNNTIYPYQIKEWYMKSFMSRQVSKTYQKFDYELEDIDDYINNKRGEGQFCVGYYQKLDDKYAVIRYYTDRYRCSEHLIENCRLYISAKGKPTIMVNESNEWKIKAFPDWVLKRSNKVNIINKDEMQEWKPLKYIYSILEYYNPEEIANILRHPIVEQLRKAGYTYIAKRIVENSEIPMNLKVYFGVEKETKIPLFKLLGVNKYILDKAENYHNINLITELKALYGEFNISQTPNEVVDMVMDYLSTVGYNRLDDLIPTHVRRYWNTEATPITEDERKWVLKLLKMNRKDDRCTNAYEDIVRTYRQMINKPDVDLYNVHNYQEIVQLHDAIVALKLEEDRNRQAAYDEYRRKELEEAKKKFEKLQDERIEKFEYENDKFCVRVPKELDDITKEGLSLHHCVGGYVNRHAEGYTNIIFLRKKEDEDRSFFTIEINNNKVIQIHGSHNRWLGNEPEAVPFMYTYLEHLGVEYDQKVLLNKGAGYSAGTESLDTSYLHKVA